VDGGLEVRLMLGVFFMEMRREGAARARGMRAAAGGGGGGCCAALRCAGPRVPLGWDRDQLRRRGGREWRGGEGRRGEERQGKRE
jgi:hypothetical protein